MNVILYAENGTAVIVSPTPEALELHGIDAIAQKDVPAGKPYKILPASALPSAPQETWIVDESQLNDGVGAESNEFSQP